MFAALRRDARHLHALVAADRTPSVLSHLRCLSRSRGFWLLAAHRFRHHWERPRPGALAGWPAFLAAKVLCAVLHDLATVLAKSDITADTCIEGGVVLGNGGHLIVGAARVGSGTVISDHVTIGMDFRHPNRPRIGRNVWIGPRCVIFGDITIGDGATILPGTVLSRNVPAGGVVQGNPARRARERGEWLRLRLPAGALAMPPFVDLDAEGIGSR